MFKKLGIVVLVLVLHSSGFAQSFGAMTYNIRLDVASDGENAWPNRKEALVNQWRFHEPAVVGIQEGTPLQVSYLNEALESYAYIGEGRDGGNNGEYSAIFYNIKKVKVLKEGTFWLSKSPDKVSVGWDAALPRICTYGLFEDIETRTKFWVFNTHFDHMGTQARTKSSELILKKIKKLTKKNATVLLMGDLNAIPKSVPIQTISKAMNDCKDVASVQFGPEETFNAFNYNNPAKVRIDYIFVSKNDAATIEKYAVLNNSLEQRFISDHFPVYIEFQIK